MKPTIAIIDQSGLLKDADVVAAVLALQKQVLVDFFPAWELDATLFIPTSSNVLADYWQLILLADSDQAGALGYHELTANGQPLGKVFVKADIESGNSWSVTLSHELLEMLADPSINTCAVAYSPEGRASFFAYECCDACENDAYGYKIDGVLVSDFVTPAWFVPGSGGPFDHQGQIQQPLQLLPGGYIGVYENGDWRQVTADKQVAGPAGQFGSRRSRRRVPQSHWRRSLK